MIDCCSAYTFWINKINNIYISIDGGFANSVYLPVQQVDGGDANG